MNRGLKKSVLTMVILVISASFLLAGCAIISPKAKKFKGITPPPTGKSVVYFYRPFSVWGGSDIPSIYHNDKKSYRAYPCGPSGNTLSSRESILLSQRY